MIFFNTQSTKKTEPLNLYTADLWKTYQKPNENRYEILKDLDENTNTH